MSRRWTLGVGCGLVAALATFALVSAYDVPPPIARILAPPDTEGSARVELTLTNEGDDASARLHQAVVNVRDRLEARGRDFAVSSYGDEIVVELDADSEAEARDALEALTPTAALELIVVADGSAYMERLAQHVAEDTGAQAVGIAVDTEQWRHDESGQVRSDTYLTGPSSDVLEDYLHALWRADPALAPESGHAILLGQREAHTGATTWRTYYVIDENHLPPSSVAAARVDFNPMNNKPEVLVELDAEGGRAFGDLTAEIIGRKLAMVLDGRVTMAPVVQAPIRGGSVLITVGGDSYDDMQRKADDLVATLRAGAVSAPLTIQKFDYVGAAAGSGTRLALRAGFALLVGLAAFGLGFGLGLVLEPASAG